MEKENNKLMKEIGIKIKFMRNKKNISSAKFAQMIGISRQQLQNYESGAVDIKIDRLYNIAKVLDVNVTFFFENRPSLSNEIDFNILSDLERIKDAKIKESIYGLLRELSKNKAKP